MNFNIEQREDRQWYVVFDNGTVLGGYDKATIARVCANAYVQDWLIRGGK